MLSRPPASFACATSLVQAASWIRLRAEGRRDRLVCQHLGQSVRTQQQAIAGVDLQRVSFDVDARFVAAHDVRDDMAKTVVRDLLGLKRSPTDHLRHQRVVVRDLVQPVVLEDVRPAVPDVDDT